MKKKKKNTGRFKSDIGFGILKKIGDFIFKLYRPTLFDTIKMYVHSLVLVAHILVSVCNG